MFNIIKRTGAAAFIVLGFAACSSDEDQPPVTPDPVIESNTTEANAETTLTSITISASIDYGQPENLLAYGVAWGTEPNPGVSGNATDESSSEANLSSNKAQANGISFTSEITDLTPNETYYFRVYATTDKGTTYGDQMELSTLSLSGTTWDFTFNHSETVTWNADVTFYEDGTSFYTEPATPGLYDEEGTWSLEGDQLTFDLMGDSSTESYLLTGTVSGKQMEGTYTFGEDNLPWEAVLYEE